MNFKSPQIILYVHDLEKSKEFYQKLGFTQNFVAEIDGKPVHYELLLDGFNLGIATKESAHEVHGLTPGKNMGCEIVLWTEDTDSAIQYIIENGATLMSEPHNFFKDLRAGWVQDLDGNPIQIVCKRKF
ncbi:VOC family protein [Niallia sp.]|uniref:VOC family protein n=1 Tax=Niallia sp. TaxID=2837523 RepID=UPI00289B8CB7|nr:VOC family protein [Niallia sp.]